MGEFLSWKEKTESAGFILRDRGAESPDASDR